VTIYFILDPHCYLVYQFFILNIVNIDWDKLQAISNSVLSTITATSATTNATSTTAGVGVGPIQAILGNNSTAATTTHILPITSTMANLGIPLTGSTAMGFTIGILKG
jgi:hypothetical protein